jgi:hypothetical protein
MACKSCNGFDSRGYEGGFVVALSDLQESCRVCSFLQGLVRHFAPGIEDTLVDPFLHIDLQEGNAANVEVAGEEPAKGTGSYKTSAIFYVYRSSCM